jgi:hypothetical protein
MGVCDGRKHALDNLTASAQECGITVLLSASLTDHFEIVHSV